MNELSPNNLTFEDIRKFDEEGNEYWFARELGFLMEYARWENFETAINRAISASENSGQPVENHFRELTKMVKTGSGAQREIKDYKLSRYACYLIAQNGDPSKQVIARAQTYFAVQTRKQEILEGLEPEEKRLHIRSQVKDQNKELMKTAARSGVEDFATFNKMGYLGLYGMSLSGIIKKKGIGKDHILDRAGSTELAANLFRITQTDDKLKRDKIKSEGEAFLTHGKVGQEVRKAIKEIGGVMPEHLPPEEHIKNIEKRIKQDQKKIAPATKPLKIENPKGPLDSIDKIIDFEI